MWKCLTTKFGYPLSPSSKEFGISLNMNTHDPNDWHNPYMAPETGLASERDSLFQTKYFWLRFGIGLQALVLMTGIGASFVKIESILFSGPALAVAGIVLVVLAWRKRNIWAMVLGISGPVFSIFLLVLINVLEWSPDDAKVPVPKIGLAYLAAVLILILPALLETRSRQDPGRDSPPV